MPLTNLDYIELRKQLEARGLLRPTPVYYFLIFSINLLLLVGFFWILIYYNRWQLTVLLSFPMAIIFMQFAFLGHDAGHMAPSKKKKVNDLIGYFAHTFVLGASFSYWKHKHNMHHAHPNHEDLDPDINNDPFSFSEKSAKNRKGISRIVTRFQSFLLPPVFIFMLFLMRYDSIKFMVKARKGIIIDVLLITAHLVFFFVIVPYFIGFLSMILLYLILSVVLGLYFGFAFIPNHVGMPVLTGKEELSYLEEQVITSRDIKCGKFLDMVFGGLNYQIEHHIFPNLSRKNLPKIKAIVRDFCENKGIKYNDGTLGRVWYDIFAYLNDVGKYARKFDVIKAAIEMV